MTLIAYHIYFFLVQICFILVKNKKEAKKEDNLFDPKYVQELDENEPDGKEDEIGYPGISQISIYTGGECINRREEKLWRSN